MKLLSAEHLLSLLKLGLPDEGKKDASESTKIPTSAIKVSDPLQEHAERTWPARNGHKAGCCAYYDLNECECQKENWKPSSAGNYPRNINPPGREPELRDRL